MNAHDLQPRDPHDDALLRACLLTSFAVYVIYGASVALGTWSIAEREGGVGAVFGAMLFFYLPNIVAPYFVGFVIDKNMRFPWLSAVALCLIAGALALFLTGGVTHALICTILAVTSYVRELSNILVRKRMATRCRAGAAVALNGRETTARRLGYLAGTLAGGGLLAGASLAHGYLALLVALLATWALLHHIEKAHGCAPRTGRLRTSFSRVRHNLAGTRVPTWIVLIVVHTLIAELLASSLAAFVLTRISDSPMIMGIVSNAYILGALLGGVILGRLNVTRHVVTVLGLSMGVLGIAMYGFSLASSIAGAVVGYFVVGALFQGRILCQVLIQTEFDKDHQAKLQSFVSVLSGVATMASLALLSGFSAIVTPELVYRAIAGALVILCVGCLVIVRSPRAVEARPAGFRRPSRTLVEQPAPIQ